SRGPFGRGAEETRRTIPAHAQTRRERRCKSLTPRRPCRKHYQCTLSSLHLGLFGHAGSQKNLAAGTELENFALAAVGFARVTSSTPVPDEPVTPICPLLARDEFH